jgi:hypothetical protein
VAAAEPRSAWLSVECVSAERAVTFVTVRLAADIAADNWHCGCPTWTANNALASCCAHDHLPRRGNQHRRR